MAIGVKASASLGSLSLAMSAILNGSCTKDYILELVALETSGKSRTEKVNRTIRRMTVNNQLLPFIKEHSHEFLANSIQGTNKTAVYTALMCAAYPLFYDLVTLLGKHFHVQDEVPTSLIIAKLSEKYGSSVDSTIGFNSAIKMLVEAGLITRPETGIYKACRLSGLSDFSLSFYKKAFLVNNPTYSELDNIETYPYFEFIS
ncbi:MAG: hypothetical protein E7069_03725 [Bacteroidales bacterium]|jgi:hypothetical protein|nr:hypothetical protein [Bacteroidales bacterium]